MLKPLWARVLLEREKIASASKLLVIPDSAARRNAPCRGKIIAVGPTAEESIKQLIGTVVVFGQHAGTWINEKGLAVAKPEDGEYFVCDEQDLIAEVSE